MAQKRTYKVTLPNGEVATRTTETKHYRYAVIVSGSYVIRWSETYEAATRFARSNTGRRVVTVDEA